MEEYDVDLPIGDLLRWIREDVAGAAHYLQIGASKSYRVETDFDREAFGIAEDDEDLQLVVATGVMEIRPREPAGWLLRITAEDTTAVSTLGGGDSYEDVDDVTAGAFEEEFILPEKGEVEVTVEAEDDEAKARFDRWLAGMLDDGHPR